MADEKTIGDVPTIDQRGLVRLDRADTIWAFVVEYPAERTEAGSLVPASETLIRITQPVPKFPGADPANPVHFAEQTHMLVSALRDELEFQRRLARLFSKHTGLKVTLRRFKEEIDEEVIQDA